MRTVEELIARAPDRFDITVIGGEPHSSYNHILLSSVLAGERTLAEIVIQPSSWYEKHGIHLIAGKRERGQAQRWQRDQQTSRPRVLDWPRHNLALGALQGAIGW